MNRDQTIMTVVLERRQKMQKIERLKKIHTKEAFLEVLRLEQEDFKKHQELLNKYEYLRNIH
jgi:hypothetical protein